MSGCDVENLVSSVQNVLLNREGCECDCPVNYGGVCCELCKFSTDTHSCMLSSPACHMTLSVSQTSTRASRTRARTTAVACLESARATPDHREHTAKQV